LVSSKSEKEKQEQLKMAMKFFENYMDSETTNQEKFLFEEDMKPIPPTLLELYEHDQDMFIDLINNRKKNWGLFDVTKSLDEDFAKALDMISFIVSRFPQSLTEREVYVILMKTSNPKDEGSCIRTNSNWICFSAIYYSEICGISFPVSLNDIDDIS